MSTNIITSATITALDTTSGYPTSNLADGNLSTYWRSNSSAPGWVLLDFGATPIKIGTLKIASIATRTKTFDLQGSNDGSSFTTLYTGAQTNDNNLVEHTVDSETAYRYYRIYITETWNSGYGVGLTEIEVYESTISYKTSGSAVYSIAGITATVAASSINWVENKPTGTTITVSASTDGENYNAVSNSGALFAANTVLDSATVYIKVEMSTADATVTPMFSDLHITIQSVEDINSIVLELEPLQRFNSAVGNIAVSYDGDGDLAGEGGPVASFDTQFTPADLVAKPHQNDQENIEISTLTATGTLTLVTYSNTKEDENIEISSIEATGTLTHIDDL